MKITLKQIFKLKKDLFRFSRGGYARFLNIYCQTCSHHIVLYQKDGPGPLKRLYADRIVAPNHLCDQQLNMKISSIRPIICSHCQTIVATPYIYEKESRLAFLVTPGSIIKRIGKGIYINEPF